MSIFAYICFAIVVGAVGWALKSYISSFFNSAYEKSDALIVLLFGAVLMFWFQTLIAEYLQVDDLDVAIVAIGFFILSVILLLKEERE